MDAIILGLLPAVLFAVAGAVLLVYLRNQDEGSRYQHEEYRPEDTSGNAGNGNGHGPPRRRRPPRRGD
ncbi:MAG TPA: hypothetical protein VGL20_12475 [Candidatus Dormibacteraeota bacterium]